MGRSVGSIFSEILKFIKRLCGKLGGGPVRRTLVIDEFRASKTAQAERPTPLRGMPGGSRTSANAGAPSTCQVG